eukprot:CAMPEP_0202882206 /NCGR_PEP_ID=MMETSP1391-20130828/37678_1 /ASSEMBLY_ACC=CAM_ASM_000867 /TAXON_ID=1034604 /ORGANISM="Chlamydomonas leiostraca, Strain SAG 11-49" /LENGTH=222 /DNA_ID=CAMNT_0049565027 /DNA_START=40 /DNA_END=705 /DNA_ORIENTATION=-
MTGAANGDAVTATKGHGIPDTELKEIMAANKNWFYPAHDDGFVHAHDAIRLDMKMISEALKAVVAQLKGGQALQGWQVDNLKAVWANFVHNTHHHHENEEAIFFPWINERVALPPKMEDDHVTLIQAMDECGAIVDRLAAGQPAEADARAVGELSDKFDAMRASVEAHLKEEEEVALPLVRKHYTYKEFQPVEKKIVAGMTPLDMGWFLLPFPGDAERRKWM